MKEPPTWTGESCPPPRHIGWKPTICLPSNASAERKNILRSLGAELILTSPLEGTDGAQDVAKELYAANPEKYYYADQYSNDANWQAHYLTTAEEIWAQTNGDITHFVAGLGTTGTFVGTGRRLKELGNVTLISLQPDHPFHPLEGWKHLATAHRPKIYDDTIADATLIIDSSAVYDMVRSIAADEDYIYHLPGPPTCWEPSRWLHRSARVTLSLHWLIP